MKRQSLVLVLATVLAVCASRGGAQDASAYKIVVHPDVGMTQATRLKVGEIFLKKTTRWPDGHLIMPVEPPGKTAVRQRFSLEVYGKPVTAISFYWQQMIFGGKGVPPPEKPSDAEIVAYVRETPGAIGYVWAGADTSGLRLVTISD